MSAAAPTPPQRVLILKPSSLGDVVGAMPLLRGLRRSFPQAHIAWMVAPPFADLLRQEKDLDEVVLFQRKHFGRIGRSLSATTDFLRFCRDLRRGRFDWVIDCQGLLRTGFFALATGAAVRAGFADCREKLTQWCYTHAVDVGDGHAVDRNIRLARALGVDARPEDFRLTVSDSARTQAEALLAGRGLRPKGFILAHPGTTWPNKYYPPRLWRRVVAELSQDRPFVLTGTAVERALCDELASAAPDRCANLAGATTLPQFVAVAAMAAAAVCSDTAANFIAPAVGTSSVALLGPTPGWYIGPYGGRGESLQADLPCVPCRKRTCRHVTCMQSIPPEQVCLAVRRILHGAN